MTTQERTRGWVVPQEERRKTTQRVFFYIIRKFRGAVGPLDAKETFSESPLLAKYFRLSAYLSFCSACPTSPPGSIEPVTIISVALLGPATLRQLRCLWLHLALGLLCLWGFCCRFYSNRESGLGELFPGNTVL